MKFDAHVIGLEKHEDASKPRRIQDFKNDIGALVEYLNKKYAN